MSRGEAAVRGAERFRLSRVCVLKDGDSWVIHDPETGARLRTKAPGARAVLLMKKGLSLAKIEARLARQFGYPSGSIDLSPLVRALRANRMIRPADEQDKRRPSLSGATAFVLPVLIRLGPLPLLLRLLYRERHEKNGETLSAIRSNLGRVKLPAVSVPAENLIARCYALLRQSYIDRLLLASLRPARLRRWLRKYTAIDGAAYLTRECSGVLLSGFHTGSYSMMPFILGAWGVPVTVLMNVTPGEEGAVRKRMGALDRGGFRHGIRFVFGSRGIRTVARALSRGETALVLPDTIPAPGARTDHVEIFGNSVKTSAVVEWLQATTGAMVLPALLRSGPGLVHRMTIHAPVQPGPDFVERLYAPLASLLSEEPHQWLRWKDLDKMAAE